MVVVVVLEGRGSTLILVSSHNLHKKNTNLEQNQREILLKNNLSCY